MSRAMVDAMVNAHSRRIFDDTRPEDRTKELKESLERSVKTYNPLNNVTPNRLTDHEKTYIIGLRMDMISQSGECILPDIPVESIDFIDFACMTKLLRTSSSISFLL